VPSTGSVTENRGYEWSQAEVNGLWDLSLGCQSRMQEGGIVPPHSVLAPGTTLELLLSRALPFAQVQGIVAVRMMIFRKLTKKGDIVAGRFGRLFDPSCRRHSLRSLPFGPTRGGPWMQRLRPEMVVASQHDALIGVALTVRNSHQINRVCRFTAELLMLDVSGTSRRNGLGAIASDKNDCNFP
jgi:hypothetical protein